MSSWDHFQAKIFHVIWASDDQQGMLSLCEVVPDVVLWGVGSIVDRGIHGFPPPDAAWTVRKGYETTTFIESSYAKGIRGVLPADGHIH